MEKNFVRVPFETGLAKKITNGEVEGRIVTRSGNSVRILCFDRKGTQLPIIALIETKCGEEDFFSFYINGNYDMNEYSPKDLFLEIPEYMTFKDGDIIKLSNDTYIWLSIIKDIDLADDGKGGLLYFTHDYVSILINDGDGSVDIDTYSDGGRNVERATEEEKQKLISALKASKEPKAKEYLERFFPNHSNSSNIGRDCEFKPKDWILCKGSYCDIWTLCQFSHIDETCSSKYVSVGGNYWKRCITYNEQTAHLLGTTNEWEEK